MRLSPGDWKWADVPYGELWVPLVWALIVGAIITISLWSAVGCGLLPEQSQETDVDADRGSAVRTEQNQERGTATAEGDARNVSSHSYQLGEGWRTLLMDWWRRGVVIIAGFLLGVAWVAGRMTIGYLDMAAGVGIAGAFTAAALLLL